MTDLSRTILETYQIRKTKKQKAAFRQWLCGELTQLGYAPREEQGGFSRNIVVGDPETAQVIFTAHYDTCAVLPIPNFITPRNLLWYLLYQLVLVGIMFALAIGAEVGLLLLWEDCPMWAAIGAVYAVLLFCCWWLLTGPANRHTVNDNTSGVLTLVELAQALPAQRRDQVALVFFDNEEKGLFGSTAFAKAHKSVQKDGLVVNFDCVSDGDYIQFFPTAAVKKERETLDALARAFPAAHGKTTEVVTGFGFYPSDQARFRRGVGVCALKKNSIFGYYMDRIHTRRDTVLMEENIHLLREGSLHLVEMI